MGLVEALDVRVRIRLAGRDEAQLDAALLGLILERIAGQFAPVIEPQRLRRPLQRDQLVHHPDPLVRCGSMPLLRSRVPVGFQAMAA